jgi:hypothetical protein
MTLNRIGFIAVCLLLIALASYAAMYALLPLVLSGAIDEGSPLQYAGRSCFGQASVFPEDVPIQDHVLRGKSFWSITPIGDC